MKTIDDIAAELARIGIEDGNINIADWDDGVVRIWDCERSGCYVMEKAFWALQQLVNGQCMYTNGYMWEVLGLECCEVKP
jgi:hypothetical protein